ncbi:G-patch domain and KOW motifs-containing protein [Hyposmocoma kahamanoa]|uniref:G-patch domain and KOW motifs-containing protein n=1 Tax=Hyposmocoma kahamanoa TaxID=1477025 RepID=UPI000E6D6E23|nr:G-patch domain and KOW motifs-containing protein [Hyposmocoma kahamanoa]
MEGKKISFGFFKTKKAEKPVAEEKKEYIDCIDEKAIKVVGGETVQDDKPLVIPMKANTLITAERLKEIAEKVELGLEEPVKVEDKTEESNIPENETLEQMAVRELLQDAKKEVNVDTPSLTVPVAAKPAGDAKESTLDDYESIPIQDFGLAMLRGMGWNPSKDQSKYKQPALRPKGLGLGADKVIKENQKKSGNDKEEELSIVKNSFVKITIGKYSGCYGKVISLDEDNGRVMVDIPIKKETVNLSEFMMQAVTKSEYDKESKVINADLYEQYKRDDKSQTSKHDSPNMSDREASSSHKYDSQDFRKDKRENHARDYQDSPNGRSMEKSRRDSSSSSVDRKRKKKDKKRYSSSDSLSSLSDYEKKKKHKKKKHSSSDFEDNIREKMRRSKTPEGKRDIDKKRKGKKKKRDRDRSPNYRKHRK